MTALQKLPGASSFAVPNIHVGAECGIWYQHRLGTLFSRGKKKNTNKGRIKSETKSDKFNAYRICLQ